MSEAEQSINNVSQSIANLSQTLAENDKRFKLSSSRIVKWSQSTGKAGKRWTTFSRITSGTGLWKFQNYMRGTLEIIGAFGERTDEAIKAQTEQEKALAQSIKGVRKIGEEYTELTKVHKTYTDRIEKAEKDMNSSLVQRVKETKELSEQTQKRLADELKAVEEMGKQEAEEHSKAVTRAKGKLKLLQQQQTKIMARRRISQEEYEEFKKKEEAKMQAVEYAETVKENFAKNTADRAAEVQKLMTEEMKKRDAHIKQLQETYKEVDITKIKIADYTDSQLEALESTNAFNQAIIRGKSEQEAYAAAFEQVTENVEKNKKSYDSFKVKLQEAIKIQEAFDKGAGSPEFKQLEEDEKKKRKEQKQFLGIPDMGGDDGIVAGINKFFKPAIKAFNAVKKQEERQKLFLKIQMKGLAFQQFMRPILNMAFKFLIFGILGMIALLAVAKIAYDIVDIMGQFGVLDDIKEIIGSVLLIGGAIFGAVGAFLSGDFTAMFDYLSTIMASFLEIGWNLFTIFINGVFAVAVGLFYSIFDLVGWLLSDGNWKKAGMLLLKIGGMLLVIYFVKYLLSQALLLIGIYALPIMIFVLISALLTALLMQLYKRIDSVKKPFERVLNTIKDALTDDPDEGFYDTKIAPFLGLHKGGLTTGRVNLVGEKGPELVKLPAGSRVYSNSQSKSMTGGSTVINNHITINAKDTSDAELRRIAEKIGNMVNNKMNRSTSSRTMG